MFPVLTAPGRYDAVYEQKGIDYPIGYVRWTETRNMEAFLKLLADRKLDLASLNHSPFPDFAGQAAYDLITCKTSEEGFLAFCSYPLDARIRSTSRSRRPSAVQREMRN